MTKTQFQKLINECFETEEMRKLALESFWVDGITANVKSMLQFALVCELKKANGIMRAIHKELKWINKMSK